MSTRNWRALQARMVSARFTSINMMNREVGFGRRLMQVFEDEGISFEHMPSGIDNMSVIVKSASLTPEKELKLIARFNPN